MSIIASDNYTRANSTGLGANWTTWTSSTSFNIVSNQCAAPTAGNIYGDYYSAATWPADHYSKVVIGSIPSTTADEGAGPAVRMSAAAQTAYLIQGGGDTRLYKCVAGTFTQLGTTGAAVAAGDTLELDVVGTTLTAKKNGVSICGTPLTDSSIATGNAAVFGSTSNVLINLASFEGGDFTVAATVQFQEAPNRPRPGRGPFSKGRFYVSDTTAYTTPAASTPITVNDVGGSIIARATLSDFAAPNLLTQGTLKLPPFTQVNDGAVTFRKGVYTDFAPPNLIDSTLLPILAPLNPVDLSQQVKFRWSATDFNAPNLSFRLPVVTTPLTPQDLSLTVNARWVGSDFFTQNLLTGHLPAPPIAPIDATISIRAKGVFTDFSPPNLALSTLVPPAALHPIDTAVLRLEYRWIRGDDIPLNLLPLRLPTVTPIAPQDLSGMRLEARGLRFDFTPPNLTLTLPVPPPPPVSAAAGRHGTRRQARRRRELDVLRARIEAFKEQRADADRALLAIEDRELAARAKLLKRVRIKPLTKPIEQYAPIKKALAQRTVATERHRSILGQIRAHQLEAERIEREMEIERIDIEAATHLMHFLMMEIPWDE